MTDNDKSNHSKVTDTNILKNIKVNPTSEKEVYTIDVEVINPVKYQVDIITKDTLNNFLTNTKVVAYKDNEKLFDNNRFALNYYRTFYNCTGLTGVVTDEIFNQNRAINSIPANENVNSNYRGTFENCTGITEVDNSLLIIGHEMFKNCTGIENIYLHQTVDIGNEAFYGCNKLVDIQVSKDYLKTMGKDSFEYTGTNPDKLVTFINKDNEVLVNYVWLEDNRIVDVEAPKGTIEIITPKDPFTKTQSVKLKITATDNYSKSENIMMAILNENEFSENIDYNSLNWESYKQNVDWTLTEKDAIKTVYVLFKDEIGNVSRVSN